MKPRKKYRRHYWEDSSIRNNSRNEDVEEEEEADDKSWDKGTENVSSILKSKLKRNNVKIKRTGRIPTRKRRHNKGRPRTIVFKLHLYENKESIMRNVYQFKYPGHYINEDFNKATWNIRAELWDEVKRLRGEGYYAVIKYDRIVTNKLDEVAPGISLFN